MSDLTIRSFTLGDWQTNCYVVHMEGDADCWIVDAGFAPRPMLEYIADHELRPSQIILTHAHLDHILGLSALRAIWPDMPSLIHESEKTYPGDPMQNLSALMDQPIVAPNPTGFIEHGQMLSLNGVEFEVRHTPGHSPGGITLYQPDHAVAIVGDTLFAGSIGRYDFPHSDGELLFKSIREQLLTLPGATCVMAGHGPDTTIDEERLHNPFLQSI